MRNWDHFDRVTSAGAKLLADDSEEAKTLLSLLIDVSVVGEELLNAIEQAEQYLKTKGVA